MKSEKVKREYEVRDEEMWKKGAGKKERGNIG